jgi:hypothetical protein
MENKGIANLIKAVLAVMNEVKGMEKNSKVGTGRSQYDGTKYSDVAERFNDAMCKNELIILPIDIKEETQIERWKETDNYGKERTKQSVFTKVTPKYLLAHSSGETIELAGYGHGIDSQDKGAGKATTYALKNLLLYTFLTPVGKMDDTDLTHSNDIQTPQAQEKKIDIAEYRISAGEYEGCLVKELDLDQLVKFGKSLGEGSELSNPLRIYYDLRTKQAQGPTA